MTGVARRAQRPLVGIAALLTLLGTGLWQRQGGAAPADIETIVGLLEFVLDADPDSARQSLQILTDKVQSGELSEQTIAGLRERLDERLTSILSADPAHPLQLDAALLAASWNNPHAIRLVREVLLQAKQPTPRRLQALEALIAADDPELLVQVDRLLNNATADSRDFRAAMLNALGRLEHEEVATIVLRHFDSLDADLQPKAVELLTQRPSWSRALLAAMGEGLVPKTALSVNQVRSLLARSDPELEAMLQKHWGTVRSQPNEQRQSVLEKMTRLLHQQPGDARRGKQVFDKLCGQCHRIHGQGEEVGPDITENGRGSFEQLMSNVFDPSLVIGSAYQAHTVVTVDGRVLSGLLVEDAPGRVVLKLQGGKTETIPRREIEELVVSPLSLMPEGIETQLSPQEIADLFAFLTLNRPPGDPQAQLLPGTPTSLHAPSSR